MELTGTEAVRAAFRALQKAGPEQADAALKTYAEALLKNSRPHVPVQDGELRDSGHVENMPQKGWVVIYDAPHAARIHEDMTLTHPHGGGPKFLEREFLATVGQLPGQVAQAIKSTL